MSAPSETRLWRFVSYPKQNPNPAGNKLAHTIIVHLHHVQAGDNAQCPSTGMKNIRARAAAQQTPKRAAANKKQRNFTKV